MQSAKFRELRQTNVAIDVHQDNISSRIAVIFDALPPCSTKFWHNSATRTVGDSGRARVKTKWLFVQQSLRISQIPGIKALRKPPVDLREHLLCFNTLALSSQQTGKAHRRT